MQLSWWVLGSAIAAAGIVAGIGVKAWLRLPTTKAGIEQYGYKVSARDPGR